MPKKLDHYLITVRSEGFHIHSYIMTNNKKHIERAADAMMLEAEKRGLPILEIFLVTPLTTGRDTVRNIIRKTKPDAEELWKSATDFHMSMFAMAIDSPDDRVLMALH